MATETKQVKLNYSIPMAIILAGIVIGGAIYFGKGEKIDELQVKNLTEEVIIQIVPVNTTDHIQGNPNAPIVIIEYSDTECPFCKRFQITMQSIIETYGKEGKVAWVYRHFPLDFLHKKSRKEAEATECAKELGGSALFWKMLDTIYERTPANDGLDLSLLSNFAQELGINVSDFDSCLASGKYASDVEADFQDGVRAGITGTPSSIFVLSDILSFDSKEKIVKYVNENHIFDQAGKPLIYVVNGGKMIFTSGALPFEIIKTIIDIALNN